ncbi:MAG: HIT family protein [Burkholderiales bacterium]|nr:HIT family protein [Burkholderiales bacterium]
MQPQSEAAAACDTCGFKLGEPIAKLEVSDLCFVSDHRFPGRCVVVLHQHATELFDLSPSIRHAFADDVSAAARAIMLAMNAFKMNYEILGNADPHMHCHLIPRQLDEPKAKLPAWLHPEAQSALAVGKTEEIKQRIVALLHRTATA